MKDEWREKQTRRWALKRNLDSIAARPIAIMISSLLSRRCLPARINNKQFVKTSKYLTERKRKIEHWVSAQICVNDLRWSPRTRSRSAEKSSQSSERLQTLGINVAISWLWVVYESFFMLESCWMEQQRGKTSRKQFLL